MGRWEDGKIGSNEVWKQRSLEAAKFGKRGGNPLPSFHPSILAVLSLYIVSLVFIALVSPIAEGANRYAGEFLTLGVGARPLGMGGSFAAIAEDSTAAYWNPAGLGRLRHSEVAFMHSSLGNLDSYDFVNTIYAMRENGAIGLSWLRVGIDDIPITDLPVNSNRPEIRGTFSNTNNAFILSYGRPIRWNQLSLYVGGNAKLIYITALRNTNALGVGGDMGLLMASAPDRGHRLSAGIVVQDFLKTKLYWNTRPQAAGGASNTDVILPNLKLGVAYSQAIAPLNSRVLLTADTDSLYAFEMHYGAEYVFADLLSLRVGVTERKGLKTIRLMTAGAGLQLSFTTGAAFSVDYAFLGNSELGNSNRISLMTRF